MCDVRSRADDREVNGRASGLDDSTGTKVTLASAAAHLAIEHLYLSPVDTVTLEMNAEFITLAGEVSCAGDRLAVEVAVTYLAENLSVNNKIRVSERTCERASEVPSRLGRPSLWRLGPGSGDGFVGDAAMRRDLQHRPPTRQCHDGVTPQLGGSTATSTTKV